MANLDVIQHFLSQPMDWGNFERMVVEIIQQDDMPRLRKMGGGDDGGIDGIDEAFFENESIVQMIVQITSQKTQVEKFVDTIKKLKEKKQEFNQLTIVFRQPVSSTVRTELQQKAKEYGVLVDVRDEAYLVSQLGKPGSRIFLRYFEDVKKQLEVLFDSKDPLKIIDDKLRHSMMATLGAYVLNPRARLARQTLFEKTVLAALVVTKNTTVKNLCAEVKKLIPEEEIQEERVQAALLALQSANQISFKKDNSIEVNEETLRTISNVMARSNSAYESMRNQVFLECSKILRLDDATKGFVERNLRKSLLLLFRAYGPIDLNGDKPKFEPGTEIEILKTLSRNVGEKIGRTALLALHDYVENPETWRDLSVFARGYSALAIRNVDPLGRRWQKTTLSRSLVALDTDIVLNLLISDLPEHSALLKAIKTLEKEEVKIVISESVFKEVLKHISRADITHKRFEKTLERMPASSVDARVWHAVVQGYYYALRNGYSGSWKEYWARYYDPKNPDGYLLHLLQREINFTVESLDSVPEKWERDLHIAAEAIFEKKETYRAKTEYRDEQQMHNRVLQDVKMAMHLANNSDALDPSLGLGYLISGDSGFINMCSLPAWGNKPKIHIWKNALPEFVEFVCGVSFSEDEIVRMLFDPMITAAAELMKDDINILTAVGVDLKRASLGKLEWDLKNGLREKVHNFSQYQQKNEEEQLEMVLNLVRGSKADGYPLDPKIEKVVQKFEGNIDELESERKKRQVSDNLALRLINLITSQSKRGKRRVNKILKEFNLDLRETEEEKK